MDIIGKYNKEIKYGETMKNKKYTKEKLILWLGIFSLLISIMFVEDNITIFFFFFIVFSVCAMYNRKLIFEIISKPIIRKIWKLRNIKLELQEEIKDLKLEQNEILNYLLKNKENINEINRRKEITNQLITKQKQLNIEIIKLEDKKRTISQMIKQENFINKAIKEEETKFNLLSQKNIELEDKKEELFEEINILNKRINPIKKQFKFINKCSLNDIDNFNGFEFEQFCTELLEINRYENVQNTQKSVDYGIDIIAEKDNIKYAIQCKRYEQKVGNDAIQEAMAGKEYYECNIAIVLTNSTFTRNAQRLARSTGVILWDRNMLKNMIEKIKTLT